MNQTQTTPPPTTSGLSYLPGLDGLRAISILAVLFFHHYFIFGATRGFIPGGFLGVEVFFVVSGYLITALILAERRTTGRVSLRDFWIRRARRLLPALYVMLAAVIAYSLLFLPDTIPTLKGDTVAALTYTSNWWQIVAERSYFIAAGRPELLKHLWSLAIEEQFYLFWPLVLTFGLRALGRSRTLVAMVVTAAISTVLLAAISFSSIDFAYYATFTRLSGLLLGGALAFFFTPDRIRGRAAPNARLALNIAGAVGLFVLLWSFRNYSFPEGDRGSVDRSVFLGGFLLVDLATLLVIAAVVHPLADVGRILGIRPLRYIGTRSYGIYLWHYPIFCITRPTVDFDRFFGLSGWPVLVLRLGLTFGLAELSDRFVEQPIRHGAIGHYRERLRTSTGAVHEVLVRRGMFVGATLTVAVLMLGVGLASAQGKTIEIAGPTDGGVADPAAIDALRNATSSTTTTRPTGPTTTVAPPRPGVTTTTVAPPAAAQQVFAIGDSVMLGAKWALQEAIPGIVVDAAVSRQVWDAPGVLGFYKSKGLLPRTIVVHLGTNGRVTPDTVDQVMRTIGPNHTVYLLSARVPRVWEGETNGSVRDAMRRWPNARFLDWRTFSTCRNDWFVNDGFHLRTEGARAYAGFVKAGIRGAPNTQCR
ncbi:MAG: acyltransferase family protein [Actinomycetota bacterium]